MSNAPAPDVDYRMTDDNGALLEEKVAAEMKFMGERGKYPTTNNMNCPGGFL